MKLLLIAYYYSLPDSIGSLRPRAMVKYLPKNGIDVVVLTHGAQQESMIFGGNAISVRDITRNTVPSWFFYVWRLWQVVLRWFGVYRSTHEFWRANAIGHAREIVERVKPDMILASYPCIDVLEIGVVLAEKYGLPLVSDFRDGLLFESVEEGCLRSRATRQCYEALEAKAIVLSRLVLTVSEPISEYIRTRYAHPDVMTLPNGFDRDDIESSVDVDLPAGVINIVHTGRLAMSRLSTSEKGCGVNALCTALDMVLARFPDLAGKCKLHFVGQLSAQERACLVPLVRQGVVKLWGHQPRALALGFQRKADVLLLITAPDKASIATGKLFEYLAANKQILALTRGTEAARIVRETGAGVVVAPDDPKAIADLIESILLRQKEAFPQRNEEAIARFARSAQMALLASKLKSIVDEFHCSDDFGYPMT